MIPAPPAPGGTPTPIAAPTGPATLDPFSAFTGSGNIPNGLTLPLAPGSGPGIIGQPIAPPNTGIINQHPQLATPEPPVSGASGFLRAPGSPQAVGGADYPPVSNATATGRVGDSRFRKVQSARPSFTPPIPGGTVRAT